MALRAGYSHFVSCIAQSILDGLGFALVIGWGAGPVGIDVVHVFSAEPGHSQGLLDTFTSARPVWGWCGHVVGV